MSPSVAKPGALPTDPEVGTAEWDNLRAAYDAQVARLAKLQRMRAQLPPAILDAQKRVDDLAGRLGLDVQKPGSRANPGRSSDVLEYLPGRTGEIAKRMGLSGSVVNQRLMAMRRRGLVTKDEGYGGTWRRVESQEAAA